MRVGNIALWANRNTSDIRCELYNPTADYDVLIVVKTMTKRIQELADHAKSKGAKLVYDANVNYWEVWGEYDAASPKPTLSQQQGALYLTKAANLVVADSCYLAQIARKYASNVVSIPDNVDLSVYSRVREHREVEKIRLVWSGMSHKAEHLLLISEALERLSDIVELVVVSEKRPTIIDRLPPCLRVEFLQFSDRRYADILTTCDVIISPKRLANAYDLGHTEYKITLGMAAGLPAVASPQQSYVDAIMYRQGGIIADDLEEWVDAIQRLHANVALRREMGERARTTVLEKYATSVVAQQYVTALRELVRS